MRRIRVPGGGLSAGQAWPIHGYMRGSRQQRLLGPLAIAGAIALSGCGTNENQEKRTVREIFLRYAAAEAKGDGRTYCSLLTPEWRTAEDRGAKISVGRKGTCEDAHSHRPPGISRRDYRDLVAARAQANNGLRVDAVQLDGNRAQVDASFVAPKRANRILSFTRPRPGSNRAPTGAPLRKRDGVWKVGTNCDPAGPDGDEC
jgi:hypothetical protein